VKYQKTTMDEILNGCNRNTKELIKEIGDRLDFSCLQIDGTYKLPFENPFICDTLKMVLRLCLKQRRESQRTHEAQKG